MISRDRIVSQFMELTKIDSLTLKERQMADALVLKLRDFGIPCHEDNTGKKIGGNSGNLICFIKGNKDVPPVLLAAHMDTVVPGIGKKAVLEGNIIKTDGTTILGGDDVAGIVCIMEVLHILKEQDIQHGDITVAFTVAEEGGLLGAKNLDYTRINARYGFVLDDGGKIGHVSVSAPSQNKIEVTVKGKAAHAGVEPEKGISAIQIASKAISMMELGRIDQETTANIGVIHGGQATNIICDTLTIQAEARSRNQDKLDKQTNHMRDCFEKAAALYKGSVDFKSELMYPSYMIDESNKVISYIKKAASNAGVDLQLGPTGGGSDTNILNGNGITAVNLSVGMDKVHSVDEQICIDDMVKAAQFLLEIIKSIEHE